MEQRTRSDRTRGGRRHATSAPGGAVGVHRAPALDERGYGVMQFVLAILAVLTGVLTWMFASAGLRRYRTLPGADWTELVPGIVVGLITVLLAGLGIVAAKVNRQRAEVAARIAQSPDRPWLHVAGWDQGRIQEAPAKQAAVAIGAFAAMWNAVVIGVALLARRAPRPPFGHDGPGVSRHLRAGRPRDRLPARSTWRWPAASSRPRYSR